MRKFICRTISETAGKFLIGALAFFIFASFSTAEQIEKVLSIKYVSSEYVYLDGGKAEGLVLGSRLTVKINEVIIAELEVAYLSEHSAACKLLNSSAALTQGMKAYFLRESRADTTEVPVRLDSNITVPAPVHTLQTTRHQAPTAKPKVSGSFAILYDRWIDNGAQSLGFSQSTARLNLRVRQIGGKDFTFSVRSRSRYDQRSHSFSTSVPRDAWANRLYEVSLSYEEKSAPINFSIGRIPLRRMGSVGFIDGALLENRIAGPLRLGMYAGAQPNWQYSDLNLSLRKYGGYFNFTRGSYQATLLDLTMALAGEYHGSTPSRELLYSQFQLNFGDRLGLSEALEVDINRGWRKEHTGRTLTLSSIYLDSRLKISPRFSTGASYDNRRNYWTYEVRNMADSLFDDHLRQGLRARFDMRLPANFFTSLNVGYRNSSGDQKPTYSYSVNINKSELLVHHSNLSLQYSRFTGSSQKGDNFSLRIGEYIRSRDYLSIGYGFYRYSYGVGGSQRVNHWIESTLRLTLYKNLFCDEMYQFNTGDDLRGHRVQLEAGIQF